MFRQTKSEVYEYHAPEGLIAKAREFIDVLGGSEAEREEKERRKINIKNPLLIGEQIQFNFAVGKVLLDGTVRRVNGQHSCEVFLEMTPEQWANVQWPVFVNVAHFECDTPQARAHLFSQFDPAWSSRSREDQIGPHLALHDDLIGLDPYAANRATQGLLWYFQKVEQMTIFRDAKAQFELIHRNSDIHAFLRFCRTLGIDKRKTAEMGMKPVIAAMYHTTRRGDDDAQAFWRRVSGGKSSLLDIDSHEYKLAEFLDMARDPNPKWPPAMRSKFSGKKNVNDVEVFATCLRLFAAWAKGITRVETFERLRERSPKDIADKIWPLADEQAAAAD